ncbi:MAG: hypothetical protein WCJ72_11325 [Chryseobacterium sp.]
MNTNNIMYFNRQNNNSVKCNDSSNSNLGVSDPLDISLLGPRKNRSKVIAQIKDYVLLMLGAPVISIELDQQQLDACVDLSLQVLEDYAPREYFQLYVFLTSPGKSIYKMPPEVGYIRNISYKDVPTFNFSASDLGGAIPLEYFYPGGAYNSIQGGMMNPMQPIWGNMGEWVLYKQYEQMYSNIASNTGGWEWHGSYDQIKIYPIPMRSHSVIVHYIQKNKDWNRVTQAMQEGAIAFAKIMLGRIRSKIKNPPGPNGGVQLDGDTILAEGLQEKKDWEERLLTRFGDVLGPTWG